MQHFDYCRIIFICMDNTIVSPIAETLFRATTLSKEIECFSRGLVVLFQEPVNPKAVFALKEHGFEMPEFLSTQFHRIEANEHTLLLTMTESQKQKVMRDYSITNHVFTIKEFTGEDGDCIDPYGQTLLAYEECYEELARLVKKVVYQLEQ